MSPELLQVVWSISKQLQTPSVVTTATRILLKKILANCLTRSEWSGKWNGFQLLQPVFPKAGLLASNALRNIPVIINNIHGPYLQLL